MMLKTLTQSDNVNSSVYQTLLFSDGSISMRGFELNSDISLVSFQKSGVRGQAIAEYRSVCASKVKCHRLP